MRPAVFPQTFPDDPINVQGLKEFGGLGCPLQYTYFQGRISLGPQLR